jgi:iron complex transport system substrate-binding protein
VNPSDGKHAVGMALALLATGLVWAARSALALPEAPSEAPAVPAAAPAWSRTSTASAEIRVPEGGYRRILSLSLVADGILAELAEPSRVVGTTTWIEPPHPRAHVLAGLPRIDSADDIERILALQPDVVIVHGWGEPARSARLRQQGLRVVPLQEKGDAEALASDVRLVAKLLGAPARGEDLLRRLGRRREVLRAARAGRPLVRGIYLSAAAGSYWGGAAGTAAHDLLASAGVRDLAAEAGLEGWPQLRAEQLLTWDPDVVVGAEGLRAQLCGPGPLEALRVCGAAGGVVELPERVVSDPGPLRIEAAEALAGALTASAPPLR